MKRILFLFTTLLILLLPCMVGAADYIILTTTTTFDGDTDCAGTCTSADTIIIQGGARSNLHFQDLDGDGNYITIINEDTARVVITHVSGIGVLSFDNCKYIDVRGDGLAAHSWSADSTDAGAYGIKVHQDATSSYTAGTVWVRGQSDHIKLSYMEVSLLGNTGVSGGGFFIQDTSESNTWIWDTIEIHHNYVHDTIGGVMYLGQNEAGVRDNPYIANVSVHDNLIEDAGCQCILIKSLHGSSGVSKVYNNILRRGGVLNGRSGSYCDVNGDATSRGINLLWTYEGVNNYVEIYNNWIEKFPGIGISIGEANHKIYNNIILGCGFGDDVAEDQGHGIAVDENDWLNNRPDREVTAYNNTIVEATSYGIWSNDSAAGTSKILHRDNIIAECGLGEASGDSTGTTEGTGDGANTYDADADNMYFTTWSDDSDYSNDDFSLTTSSPARNASQSSGYPSYDYVGTVRPQESAADDGAYEYVPEGEGGGTPAITFDAVSSGTEGWSATLSFNHTVANQSYRMLVVVVGSDSGDVTIDSVTYNAVGMTGLTLQATSNTKERMFYLAAPTIGTNAVLITASGATTLIGGAISLFGVKQQAPEANSGNTAIASTTVSTDVTTLTDKAWVVTGAMHNIEVAIAPIQGETERVERQTASSGGSVLAIATEEIANHAANTFGYGTDTGLWAFTAAAFEPVATSDTTRPTITSVGRWIEATKTCDTTTEITYDEADDVIPLCLVCDEVLSVEVPGIESSPILTLLPGPLTASEGTAVYAGYDNSGATTVIKANYTVGAFERSVDLQIKDVASFDIGIGSSIAIKSISKATPLGVAETTEVHGLTTGAYVYFNQLGEMTEIEDNCYQIVVTAPTTFTFGVDTSGFVAAEADGGSEECFKVDSYMVDPYGNMLDVDLTGLLDLGVITIAVLGTATNPIEFSSTSTLAAEQVAGFYAIGDDYLGVTDADGIGAADMSASDGTAEHPITLDGGGFEDNNSKTYGDYWIITRSIS